jgi:hypothetical protein
MSGGDKVDILASINNITKMENASNTIVRKIWEKVIIIKPVKILGESRRISTSTPMGVSN